jgi:hypothetical protein
VWHSVGNAVFAELTLDRRSTQARSTNGVLHLEGRYCYVDLVLAAAMPKHRGLLKVFLILFLISDPFRDVRDQVHVWTYIRRTGPEISPFVQCKGADPLFSSGRSRGSDRAGGVVSIPQKETICLNPFGEAVKRP